MKQYHKNNEISVLIFIQSFWKFLKIKIDNKKETNEAIVPYPNLISGALSSKLIN